jgi:hypothetical protein
MRLRQPFNIGVRSPETLREYERKYQERLRKRDIRFGINVTHPSSPKLSPFLLASKRRPISAYQLPPDIIQSIFEQMYDDDSGTHDLFFWDIGLVASFCLVCRAWLVPARRYLYRYMWVGDIPEDMVYGGWDQEKYWVTIRDVPNLRPYVRRITAYGIKHAEWRNYLHLLPNCSILLHLAWNDVELAIDNGISSLTQVRGVQVKSHGEYFQEPVLRLHKFASLEVLAFDTYAFPFRGQINECQLLALRTCRVKRCSMVDFQNIRANTLQTLHVIECHQVSSIALTCLVAQNSGSLRDIAIYGVTFIDPKASLVLDEVALLAKL